jgi:hypothetical protein
MTATELVTRSMSELKAICVSQSIEVVGDKRSKATYINAIESFQSLQTVTEIETEQPIDLPLMEAAEMAERSTTPLDLYIESDGSPSASLPTDLSTATNYKQGASIVLIIPLILLSALFDLMATGFTSLVPLIESAGRLSVSIWRFVSGTSNAQAHPLMMVDTRSIPIDYFPA